MDLKKYVTRNDSPLISSADDGITPLSRENPEMAGLIHAAAEVGLSPQAAMVASDIRKMQRDEKIAAAESYTKMYEIDSTERMHGSELETHRYGIDSTERIREGELSNERYDIDATVTMHESTQATHRYGIDSTERMQGKELATAVTMKKMDHKLAESGIKLENEKTASGERRHYASLTTMEKIKAIEEKRKELGIESAERQNQVAVEADVHKHKLSMETAIKESREESYRTEVVAQAAYDIRNRECQALEATASTKERNLTKRVELQESGQTNRARMAKDVAVKGLEVKRYLGDVDKQKHNYAVDSNERIQNASLETALKIKNIEDKRLQMSLSIQREGIESEEIKYMMQLKTNAESHRLSQGTLRALSEDQQLVDIILLMLLKQNQENQSASEETSAAFNALSECSDLLLDENTTSITINSNGKEYTLERKNVRK
jgi:hypothetical protein